MLMSSTFSINVKVFVSTRKDQTLALLTSESISIIKMKSIKEKKYITIGKNQLLKTVRN